VRIIVADDSGHARDFARRILRRAGHEVVYEAKDGKEAVTACAALRPDVIVLDILMPMMTGKEAAEIILRDETAGHIILGSSSSQSSIIGSLKEKGCRFVGKPYDKTNLLNQLAEIEAS
jgi:CheY-like chemotaxis protein